MPGSSIFYFPDDHPHDEGEYKCIFCSEGTGIRNIIDQIEKLAQVSGIPKHDIIQLALIEEIRKIRILFEEQRQRIEDKAK